MKIKFVLIAFLCALFVFQGFAQSFKMVFVEEATQASCGICAMQNAGFDALLAANSDKVVVLKYHASLPGFDQINLDNPEEVQERMDYYAMENVPTGITNGTYITNNCEAFNGAPACLSQADIDAAYTSEAAFDLNLSAAFENNILSVSGMLTANEAVSGDLKLRLAIAERTIEAIDVPGGTNGELAYHYAFKQFITGAMGTDLNDAWETGDSYTIDETFDLTETTIYNHSTLQVIAFVQDDNTKNVLQAAIDDEIALTVTLSNNATAFRLGGLPNTICGGEQTIEPIFTLQNGGNETLTSADIIYSVNGDSLQNFAWTGTLQTLERTNVMLPAYTFVAAPNNILNISVENPNGMADENTNDNTVEAEVLLAPQTTNNTIILELIPDNFASETTWQLRDEATNVLYSGGPYTDGNTEPILLELLLIEDGCYDFEIFDDFGDGICCAFSEGSYMLSAIDGAVLLQGSQFASSELQPLILQGGIAVNDNASILAYSGLTEPFCGEVTFAPSITLQNLGVNEITSVDIEIRNADNAIATETWTGNIASVDTISIQLADISLNGDADLSFHITAVNGVEDAYTSGNEFSGIVFPAATIGRGELTMALNTDCWPEETTWAVFDEVGDMVVSGGPYEGQAGVAINETFSLVDGCYEFAYFDAYGDGLNGSQWATCNADGNLTLFDAEGTVLFEYDGSFGTIEEREIFNYTMFVGLQESIFEEGFALSPNPTSGNLTLDFAIETSANVSVSVHDMLGAEVMTTHLGTLPSGTHLQNISMSNLTNGVYLVRLHTAGASVTKKVVLAR